MKELIKKQLIKKIEEKIAGLKKEIEEAKEAIESQSEENYDSRNSNLIPSTTSINILKLEETERQLEDLRKFKVNSNSSVSLGSLLNVSFKSPTGQLESNIFFICQHFGGKQIIVEDKKISIISTNSDFFKNAKGKVAGDTFNMKISTVKIIKIQ